MSSSSSFESTTGSRIPRFDDFSPARPEANKIANTELIRRAIDQFDALSTCNDRDPPWINEEIKS